MTYIQKSSRTAVSGTVVSNSSNALTSSDFKIRSAAMTAGIGLAALGALAIPALPAVGAALVALGGLGAALGYTSLRLVNEWERLVVLRLGKYQDTRSAGLTVLVPILDGVAARIDTRIQVAPFDAQETLTRDTVPVDVDAVLFWYVYDVKKAALEVSDYTLAVSLAAQTALRDIIGRSLLGELLSERSTLEQRLAETIQERTATWGVNIQSVEIRDVAIPASLQDAMSREAQAEREKRSRIILSQAELEIAENFRLAAEQYEVNPTALTLRGWNIIREGLKEQGNVVLIPTDTLNSLGNPGAALALRQMAQQQNGSRSDSTPPPARPPEAPGSKGDVNE